MTLSLLIAFFGTACIFLAPALFPVAPLSRRTGVVRTTSNHDRALPVRPRAPHDRR